MLLAELRESVCAANLELHRQGIVLYTWGNVSGIDRARGLVVIKPSGVAYADLTPATMVVVDLANTVVEGDLNPSTDTRTHTVLYKAFGKIGGVVHTHSTYAVGWAQARRAIPCFGTTHADYCSGPVPCTAPLSEEQVRLRTHCEYFKTILGEPEEGKGKKLSFVLQEIGREINTTGAKAYDSSIQKCVVLMKDELEKAKEQVLNVL